ncbi:CbtA family protein [Marinicellulosiphila megalodicopiae]|uniref:CbtA family protein n=1 Tax=Marinicellulosiphila megalodicopiae TaxID=2724896 RepID=UPI003BB042B7
MYFKNTLIAALLCALVSSVVLSSVQTLWVTELIFEAEVFENQPSEIDHHDLADDHHSVSSDHHAGQTTQSSHHDHGESNVVSSRFLNTVLVNFILSFGLSVVFINALILKKGIKPIQIALFGVIGFCAIYFVPTLGLPAEIPGMQAVDIQKRQIWWLSAVIATLIGGYILMFSHWKFKILGAVVLCVPFIIGAPHLEIEQFASHSIENQAMLESILTQFEIRSFVINAVYWAVITASLIFLYPKFIKQLND